ncbi:MAG: ion transporter [Phaeodactylibacter sp.]|nr:ion transporter [Phaeodactylibacter sp.]
MSSTSPKPKNSPWTAIRERMHEVIFEADTPMGKAFDVILLILIVISVLVVMLDTINSIQVEFKELFIILEWVVTILFTIEYILRLLSVRRPIVYATSFFGVIDLLAILPTYLSLLFAGTKYFVVIRILRLLRVFRIFKLGHFMMQGTIIMKALKASQTKITVFLFFVSLLVVVIGSMMYVIEGVDPETNFTSIPRSIYWAVVTLTTVGFGDITPQTPLGQFFSAVVMILGYAVIAVPTGIVSAEFIQHEKEMGAGTSNTQACRFCGREGHAGDAIYCKYCGEKLNE